MSNPYQFGIEIAKKAVEEDHKGNYSLAKSFYMDAADFLLKEMKKDKETSRVKVIKKKIEEYLERAELLDKQLRIVSAPSGHSSNSNSGSSDNNNNNMNNVELSTENDDEDLISPVNTLKKTSSIVPSNKNNNNSSSNNNPLTPEEIQVLKNTSYINNLIFAPWLDIDLQEKFAFLSPFTDPNGFLKLSEKQISQFGGWKRVSELSQHPVMIETISAFSIRQTVVSDCSFVASLAICSSYEKKFRKKVITRCIYPQNGAGQPVYNPDGKYCVRLLINGVARKVIVDDYLPVGKDGKLLCSFSTNPNEFWVSIIEKAYMKVMGGYDFPGSNSNIDMYALTGWIPERINMKNAEFKPDVLFKRMLNGLRTGDVLMTMSTGPMSEQEEERTGLVPSHAYAILDVREINGLKMLLVKNPWNHRRWKGAYSELDEINWTPQLMTALGFDRKSALKDDNGVFWMNWESVCKFFDVMYLNWDPQLLSYRYTLHSCWSAASGPRKDLYNLGYNPQYRLEVNAKEDAVVWILLTKHITDKVDFADNKDYITIHVFGGVGGRVYYPDKPVIEGVKINSPHILAKLNVSKGRSLHTLVVSQYEKNNLINYTIKVYASAPFQLSPVPEIYHFNEKIIGEWTDETAGGCGNYSSFFQNPQFKLVIGNASTRGATQTTMIKIEAPRIYAAGVALYKCVRNADGSERVDTAHSSNLVAAPPQFRHGFCYIEVNQLPAGEYVIVASTFEPKEKGKFFLGVSSEGPFTLTPLPEPGAGMYHQSFSGEWVIGSTAAGCENHGRYDNNPSFKVYFNGNKPCQITARLRVAGEYQRSSSHSLNIALFAYNSALSSKPKSLTTARTHSGDYTNPRCGVVLPLSSIDPGEYLLVPSTFDSVQSSYILDVYTSLPNVIITRNV